MSASLIAERVGGTGSDRWFRQSVAGLRPALSQGGSANQIVRSPGGAAQCVAVRSGLPCVKIPLEDGWRVPMSSVKPRRVCCCGVIGTVAEHGVDNLEASSARTMMASLTRRASPLRRSCGRSRRGIRGLTGP